MAHEYDIIIFGGGIAGLFTACRLRAAGYNLIVIEKDRLGGGQTLASQGMIHGGQKYALRGKAPPESTAIAAMPARWEACFDGAGEVDLSGVEALSETQTMFPAGGLLSRLAVFAAARAVRGTTRKLLEAPAFLPRGGVYEMQEKVLEVKSLVAALADGLEGRIFKGEATELLPDGQVALNGKVFKAQAIVFAAGAGNEEALRLLKVKEPQAQRRPLRQVMVRTMAEAFYGHGITTQPKPRVTITSHPDGAGGYIWYLGGNIAEKGAKMTEAETLAFAKQEMQEIFPSLDWDGKEWASLYIDRAEGYDAAGRLPVGPTLQQRGKILLAWPTKLTFAPMLSDHVFSWLEQSGIAPSAETPAPDLPPAGIGAYPWEDASWQRL
jgi:glycine/D-amino acid oxidase-like deaminating enzyme